LVVVTTFTWVHQLSSKPSPTPETKDEL